LADSIDDVVRVLPAPDWEVYDALDSDRPVIRGDIGHSDLAEPDEWLSTQMRFQRTKGS